MRLRLSATPGRLSLKPDVRCNEQMKTVRITAGMMIAATPASAQPNTQPIQDLPERTDKTIQSMITQVGTPFQEFGVKETRP